MALHWNPFYKSRFAKANDGFIERMWRVLLNFAGRPTADNNQNAKHNANRKDEAALGLFDYMTLFVPALIDKFSLILKQFIQDKNNIHPGFWFGCLKFLAILVAIPTFVLYASLNIVRFLFGIAGMILTSPITAIATASKFEGIEATNTQHTPHKNMNAILDNDPYFNANELENMQKKKSKQNASLYQPPILPLKQTLIITDNPEVSPNTESDVPRKNPFVGLIKDNSSVTELTPTPPNQKQYQDIFQTNDKPPQTQKNNTNTVAWCHLL